MNNSSVLKNFVPQQRASLSNKTFLVTFTVVDLNAIEFFFFFWPNEACYILYIYSIPPFTRISLFGISRIQRFFFFFQARDSSSLTLKL